MSPSLTVTGIGLTTSMLLMLAPWSPIEAPPAHSTMHAWADFAQTGALSSLSSGTTATGLPHRTETRGTREVSALVSELKTDSGLTADQLGRLLGVSRRSVHNWAAGSTVAPVHEKRVRELSDLVFTLAATSPKERLNLLLDSTRGPSLFKQFSDGQVSNQKIKYSVPLNERFGL